MNKKSQFFYILSASIILLSLSFASCVSRPSVTSEEEENALFAPESYIPSSFNWQSVCEGISYSSFKSDSARVSYHLVRVDLEKQGLTLCAYPETEPYKTQSVSDFAKQSGCILAFNTSPFDTSSATEIRGVHIAKGIRISDCIEKYAALALKKTSGGTWHACVIASQNEKAVEENDFVLGGFFAVVLDGQAQHFAHHSYEARMGAGISADGKTLYIMMVEKTNSLRGLSYQQCAKVFLALGCSNALEFDGGHSTELYLDGTTLTGTSPCRKQAAMFGFKVEE